VIKLAIFSNAGEGIYCVIPKELDLALTASRHKFKASEPQGQYQVKDTVSEE